MTVCGEKVTGVCAVGKCPHFKRCCPVVWDKYGFDLPSDVLSPTYKPATESYKVWKYGFVNNEESDRE